MDKYDHHKCFYYIGEIKKKINAGIVSVFIVLTKPVALGSKSNDS